MDLWVKLVVAAIPLLLVGLLFALPILARRARMHREEVAAQLLERFLEALTRVGLVPAEGFSSVTTARDLAPISRVAPRSGRYVRPAFVAAAIADDAPLTNAQERAALIRRLGPRAYASLPVLMAHVKVEVKEAPTGEWPLAEYPERCVVGTEARHRAHRELACLYFVAGAMLRAWADDHTTADRWHLAEDLYVARGSAT